MLSKERKETLFQHYAGIAMLGYLTANVDADHRTIAADSFSLALAMIVLLDEVSQEPADDAH